MGIVLRGPGIYTPNFILNNEAIVGLKDEQGNKVLETTDGDIVRLSGIRERRIALAESVVDLGINAVKDLEQRLGHGSLREVDDIRFATNYHRHNEFPCYAGRVSHALGNTSASLQDQGAGCTGLVYIIADAHNAIASGMKNASVVVGSERLSDFVDYSDRNTCFLFGDAAGAFKLEKREGHEGIIANFTGGNPDRGDDKDWVGGYLTLKRKLGRKLRLEERGLVAVPAEDEYMVMNGRQIFGFATEVMRHAVHEVLKRSGKYQLEDVDAIIPHGANIRIVDKAAEGLREKGFKGRIVTNLDVFGNTSTASIPLAYAKAIRDGTVKEGSLVVFVSFGAGKTYGANLFRASIE